ncbi:MAG: thiamine phosphate synthase [Sedimentisphaeraceae bacterium JB056]
MQHAIYRIIDVNFNRAREAARVMEEFARFALNNPQLSGRVKSLRHKLSAQISSLDQKCLIMSRDSVDDVGLGLKVEGQLSRKSGIDVFTAAAKRLPEALRTLSETTQTFDPQMASDIEALRFQAYELEKDILIKLDTSELYKDVRLYVLIDNSAGDKFQWLAEQCIEGGADCLQLRCKNADDGVRYDYGRKLADLCKGSGVISVINDSVDIALACGADGVHLGQDDMPPSAARSIYTRPLLTGLSTHNIDQLKEAIAMDVDYVGIGPAFSTTTKPEIDVAGLGYVRNAVEMLSGTGIGHAVIGGIDDANLTQVLEAGAKCVAVHSVVTGSDKPKEVCKKLKEELLKQN